MAGYRARVRGCLLGGAVGDALGSPVEFLSWGAIRERYGAAGVTGLVADGEGVVGRVGDGTQLTVFTAEGWLHGYQRNSSYGLGGAEGAIMRDACLRWLDTQEHPEPPPAEGLRHRTGRLREERWLYARRAPGEACLSGLRVEHTPDPYGRPDGAAGPVNPGSKGCGAVMRSAPFGFTDRGAERAFEFAAQCARITHGHPTAYYAAGAFAAMINYLVHGESPEGAVRRAMELLARYPGYEETGAALRRAVDLSADGEASVERLQTLGAGRVAEEALAIGVYALLGRTRPQAFHVGSRGAVCDSRPPRTAVEAAFLLSVNHSGDSGSTGSICGNLLGAHHGDVRLPHHWIARVEGRAAIAALADDCAAEVCPGESRAWGC
ncbi:ADP-ribosylglycohydrolase family protein [Kitasatospora putterlickiae]